MEIARAAGVETVSQAQEVAARCDILLLSLPNPQASRTVMASLSRADLQGRLVIETSTVGPSDIEWLVDAAAQQGAQVIDAAIVGGVQKLARGHGTLLVGASDADLVRARPVLEAAADAIYHLGPPGSGMRAKLINNAVAHTTMVMLVEVAALAAKAGVALDLFHELMRRDTGLLRPLTHRFDQRIRNHDFSGGMPTVNARKDSALALELARELGVPLFTLEASHRVYEEAGREGLDASDYASIALLWERWTGVSFAREGVSQAAGGPVQQVEAGEPTCRN
ncbi:hypothetical protein ASF43_05490 [Pseudorhodoferax sp. Leaf267]|nr:hypothetical protein ASF43_05490 [Pseudorhodoferax sp. Leaf267]